MADEEEGESIGGGGFKYFRQSTQMASFCSTHNNCVDGQYAWLVPEIIMEDIMMAIFPFSFFAKKIYRMAL